MSRLKGWSWNRSDTAQSHWLSGLYPSSRILNTRKRNVSGTGSISGFRWKEGDIYSVGDLSKGPQQMSPYPNLKMETEPASETLLPSYLEFRTMDKVQKPSDSECCTPSSEHFRFQIWHQIAKQTVKINYKYFVSNVCERKPKQIWETNNSDTISRLWPGLKWLNIRCKGRLSQ
jgi:hypothetical protein